MANPESVDPALEHAAPNGVAPPEWPPPQLDKLPVADTAAADDDDDPDGQDFS